MFPSKHSIVEAFDDTPYELTSTSSKISKPEKVKTTSYRDTGSFRAPNSDGESINNHQSSTNASNNKNQELTYEITAEIANNLPDIDDEDEEESKIHYPDGGWRAYSVVFGSFMSCFTLFGLMNGMGAIESYIESNQLKDLSTSSVSWVFSIYMFVSLFLGVIVGPVYDIFGCTALITAGSLLTFIGLFTCGMCTELYQFIFSFGLCCGMGTGLMMFPSVSAISTWFSKGKRSFWIGVAQTGGSVGGVCFPIMLRSLFPKYGFNWAMRIFAFLNLGVDVVGIVLVKDRLKEIRGANSKEEGSFFSKIRNFVDLNAFKEKTFLVLSCALFMNEFCLLIALTYLSSYAKANGATQSESFLMITIMNTAGTFGKFVPSYFADLYGNFNVMILMSVSMTIEIFLIWLPFGHHTVALYVFIVLFGFAYAATYSLTGACVSTTTKCTKNFGKRYGSAYAFVSFGNLISLPISGSVIKTGTPAEYDKMVAFAAATCFAASCCFIYARYTIVGKKIKVAI